MPLAQHARLNGRPAGSQYRATSATRWMRRGVRRGLSSALCAEEAEQLAVLLERHDCVGPVHASVTAKPVGQAPDGAADAPEAATGPAGGSGRAAARARAGAGQRGTAAAVGQRGWLAAGEPARAAASRPGAATPDAVSPLTSALCRTARDRCRDADRTRRVARPRGIRGQQEEGRERLARPARGPGRRASRGRGGRGERRPPPPGSGSGADRDHGPQSANGPLAGPVRQHPAEHQQR